MSIKTIQQAVDMLNNMLTKDREGVSAFFLRSSFVDFSVSELPVEVANCAFDNVAELFPLGLINGIVAEYSDDGIMVRRIGLEYDSSGRPIISKFLVEEY